MNISTDQSFNKMKKKEYNVNSKKSSFNTQGKPNEIVENLNQSHGHNHNKPHGSTSNAKNGVDKIDDDAPFQQRQQEVPCIGDKTVPNSNNDKSSQKHISKFHKFNQFSISRCHVCSEA